MDRVTSVHPTQFFKFDDVLIGQETIFSLNIFQNNISRCLSLCAALSCVVILLLEADKQTNKQTKTKRANKQATAFVVAQILTLVAH